MRCSEPRPVLTLSLTYFMKSLLTRAVADLLFRSGVSRTLPMKMSLSKRRICLIQLEQSLRLLEEGDPVSALTLAGAVEEILGCIAKRNGHEPRVRVPSRLPGINSGLRAQATPATQASDCGTQQAPQSAKASGRRPKYSSCSGLAVRSRKHAATLHVQPLQRIRVLSSEQSPS